MDSINVIPETDTADQNNDEDADIPKDFEPGCSKDCIFLTTESYEEEDVLPEQLIDHQIGDIQRRASNISEIETYASINYTSGADGKSLEDSGEEILKSGSSNCSTDTKSTSEEEPEEGEIDAYSPEWKEKEKHVFVLSEAGKPIYSRHGNEDKFVTMMGVIQALVSFVQGDGDVIRSIRAGSHKFVFLMRPPLILVTISTTHASVPQLVMQLNYVYNQILSVLTYTQLNRIFEHRRNYDLRRLLGGSEKFLDMLIDTMDRDPSFLLSAVRCLPLDSAIRDTIGQTIAQQCAKEKNLVFAILISDKQLVTLVRMKKYSLYPADLHLIINLVNASESFKTAESWTPICLPRFDSSGFLHSHVSYLDDEYTTCLLLLTVDKNMFFELKDCRKKIAEKLRKHQCFAAIKKSQQTDGYSVMEVAIPELRHFLYKSRSAAQFTSPRIDIPYREDKEWLELFGLYQYLHNRMYSSARPLKMLFYLGPNEAVMGWHMPGFELYAAFDPLVTKMDATTAMKKIVHWIKNEEDRLFLMNGPTI